MPIHILATAVTEGPNVIPGWQYIKTYVPIIASVVSLKYYFAGAINNWERKLHGQVYVITGGTSGLGASIVDELASNGAQIILLVKNLSDGWLIDHIDQLREKHGNMLIYAEECDLNSLYSIRKFATNWLNNQTPRRLDGIILCAGESLPIGKPRQLSADGVESQIAKNYLANFHLLTLMAPAVRSQPSDRTVKILIATCLSQVFGDIDVEDLLWENRKYPVNSPWKIFGTSKLLLGCFAKEYQRRLDTYERSDKTPMSVKVNLVNPGIMRSPSTQRFLSFGTLWGLILYVLMYPLLWIFLKSTYHGAQTFLYGLMNTELDALRGGNFLQECSVVNKKSRKELNDPELQKVIYDKTEKLIEDLEKKSAIQRKKQKILEEKKSKKGKSKKERKEQKEPTKEQDSQDAQDKKFINENESRIQEELKKMSKDLPLFGEKPLTHEKENKYLKHLDARFEASRKKQTAAAPSPLALENEKLLDKQVVAKPSTPLLEKKKSRKL